MTDRIAPFIIQGIFHLFSPFERLFQMSSVKFPENEEMEEEKETKAIKICFILLLSIFYFSFFRNMDLKRVSSKDGRFLGV